MAVIQCPSPILAGEQIQKKEREKETHKAKGEHRVNQTNDKSDNNNY